MGGVGGVVVVQAMRRLKGTKAQRLKAARARCLLVFEPLSL
jgi:hypothetical protein